MEVTSDEGRAGLETRGVGADDGLGFFAAPALGLALISLQEELQKRKD